MITLDPLGLDFDRYPVARADTEEARADANTARVQESKTVKGSYHAELVDERGNVQWRDMTPRPKDEALSLARSRLKATSRSDTAAGWDTIAARVDALCGGSKL